MPPLFRTLVFLATLSAATLAHASTLADFDFSGNVSEAHFKEIISELRCLVCQNESLAASQAELAQDLREEVYTMMDAGKTDDEIVEFLVARYGDFVLYDPPLKPSTWLLWFGPFVLAALALFVMGFAVRKRTRGQDGDLTSAQREKVAALLGDETKNRES
ncbi:MAG: cytochrome c-type biogenesis protein [Pseudomonadota bacterium]|nr:cytochrome c-type biogenesis protein [Pseudomonadota bacterium]